MNNDLHLENGEYLFKITMPVWVVHSIQWYVKGIDSLTLLLFNLSEDAFRLAESSLQRATMRTKPGLNV